MNEDFDINQLGTDPEWAVALVIVAMVIFCAAGVVALIFQAVA